MIGDLRFRKCADPIIVDTDEKYIELYNEFVDLEIKYPYRFICPKELDSRRELIWYSLCSPTCIHGGRCSSWIVGKAKFKEDNIKIEEARNKAWKEYNDNKHKNMSKTCDTYGDVFNPYSENIRETPTKEKKEEHEKKESPAKEGLKGKALAEAVSKAEDKSCSGCHYLDLIFGVTEFSCDHKWVCKNPINIKELNCPTIETCEDHKERKK